MTIRFLPRFLNEIKNCKCTKEWLISPSTMDEVFIKVVESNSNVEVADEINREEDEVFIKVVESNSNVEVADEINREEEEKENRVQIKLCVICGKNPAEKGIMNRI